jgi:hypothetical protein
MIDDTEDLLDQLLDGSHEPEPVRKAGFRFRCCLGPDPAPAGVSA